MAAQSSSSSSEGQARARYVQAAAASAGVQFDEEMRWLCRVRETLEHASAEALAASAKVFDVPRALRDTKPDAYKPQYFALGPYHQSRPDLKDMERYKLAAAKRAERLFAGDRKFPDLVYRFLRLQGQIRGPYHRFLEQSNETLAWMMAIDTCFLLDFLLGRYQQQQEEATDMAAVSSATNWINATVRDAMMLENQLPLVLLARNLELRYAYASEEAAADVLRAVLDRFIKDVCPIKTFAHTALPDFTKQAHLLELLYHFLVPSAVFHDDSGKDDPPPEPDPVNDHAEDDGGDLEKQQQQLAEEYDKVKRVCLQVSNMRFVKENLISRPKNLASSLMQKLPPVLSGLLPVVGKMIASQDVKARLKDVDMGTNMVDSPLAQEIKIPSVEQLAGCGVRFVPAPEGIAGVAFDEKRTTLSLPVVVLDGNTEVVLRNLVAYEAVAVRGPLVLARYTELMNGIVDTAKDVKILQQSGVVVNRMKSKAEAASMWNGMCRATRVSRVPRLDAVVRAVNAHRDRTASARAQKLLNKYVFGSWKILTLLASLSLLLRLSPTALTQIGDAFVHLGHAGTMGLGPKCSAFQQRTQKSPPNLTELHAPPAPPRRAELSLPPSPTFHPSRASLAPCRSRQRARLATVDHRPWEHLATVVRGPASSSSSLWQLRPCPSQSPLPVAASRAIVVRLAAPVVRLVVVRLAAPAMACHAVVHRGPPTPTPPTSPTVPLPPSSTVPIWVEEREICNFALPLTFYAKKVSPLPTLLESGFSL